MQFHNPLIPGRLIQRYKRFLADIELEDGQIITVHCPNSGAMLGVKAPGSQVWLSRAAANSARKYPYTWELIDVNGELVGINTQYPNALVAEALSEKQIPELNCYNLVQREIKYAVNSRIDFYLTNTETGGAPCYLEVKNVHLKRGDRAEFPDCVTTRGSKHLQALTSMVQQGARAVILYVIQRQDCHGFRIASDIDAQYDVNHRMAVAGGVEVLCYQCHVSLQQITLDKTVNVID